MIEGLPLSINAGFFGIGIVVVSLTNIKTIDCMCGLSDGTSCTHNNPMWMHLNTSACMYESPRAKSINSTPLSSFHSFHA